MRDWRGPGPACRSLLNGREGTFQPWRSAPTPLLVLLGPFSKMCLRRQSIVAMIRHKGYVTGITCIPASEHPKKRCSVTAGRPRMAAGFSFPNNRLKRCDGGGNGTGVESSLSRMGSDPGCRNCACDCHHGVSNHGKAPNSRLQSVKARSERRRISTSPRGPIVPSACRNWVSPNSRAM